MATTDASKKKGKSLRAKPRAKESTTKAAPVASPRLTKRKADEDASPVASKKAKSAKAASAEKTVKEKKKEEDAVAAAVEGESTSKKKTKKASKKSRQDEPVEEPSDEPAEAGADDDEEADEEATKALVRTLGFSDDDDEDAEGESTFREGADVGVVPKVSSRAKKSIEASAGDGPRVIYIGHIPYGFFEHEIRQYFTQFGPITNLRVSRSKKTGASKGYAFVEFAEASTAAIVAKTMDSYLLFGRVLKVKLVPKESQHEALFKGANKRFKKVPWTKLAGKELEKPKGEAAWEHKVGRESRRRSGRLEKLRAVMGYEFEPPALKPASAAVAAGLEGKEPVQAIEAPPPAEEKEIKAIEAPPPAGAEPETANGASAKKAKSAAKVKKGAKGKKVRS